LLHTGEATEVIPATDVQCVDTSGAGDAFNAAFALSLAQGQTPAEAVRRGCIAGGLIVQGPGFVDALHLLDRFESLAQS
jgi:ribokinase